MLTIYARPINYIAGAIWGPQEYQQLDSLQEEINATCRRLEKDIFDILQLQTVSPEQKYAIQFLIRELLLSKLGYSTELMKNYIHANCACISNHPESVLITETIGCA